MANFHATGNSSTLEELFTALKSCLNSAGLTQLHEASTGNGTRLHFQLASGYVLNLRKVNAEYVQDIVSPAGSNFSRTFTGIAFNISEGAFNSATHWAKQEGYPFAHLYPTHPSAFFVNVSAQEYVWAFVFNEATKAFFFAITGTDGKHGMIAGGVSVNGIGVDYKAWQVGCINVQSLTLVSSSASTNYPSFDASIPFRFDVQQPDSFNFYVKQNTTVDGTSGWKSIGYGYDLAKGSPFENSLLVSNLYAPLVATLNSQAKLPPAQFLLIRNDFTSPYSCSVACDIPDVFWSNATSGPYVNGSLEMYGTKRMLFIGQVAVQAHS